MRHWSQGLALAMAASLMLTGCGGGDSAPVATGDSSDTISQQQVANDDSKSSDGSTETQSSRPNLPAVSISTVDDDDDANDQAEVNVTRPDKGTPEWCILQIIELQQSPLPESDDIEKQRESRKARNLKIIEFATSAIGATHDDAKKEQVFNVAVHRLMDATYQLAMQGDQDSVNALYEHADSLFKRNPQSRAARESGWVVTKFANKNAQRFAQTDSRWVKEFSQQARLFGERFPKDPRAIAVVNDAALSCDFYGVTSEATLCYTTLRELFPQSQQASNAVAPLRRLALVGKKLDLGGPTADGAFLTVDNFKGSPVLIAFWSTQAKPFTDNVQAIRQVVAKYEAKGLHVIGVNLDVDELAIDTFVEKTGLGWRTLFHADSSKRGWNHPVAVYYGVRSIPQFWFVNPDGTVATTTLTPASLDAGLTKLMPPSK